MFDSEWPGGSKITLNCILGWILVHHWSETGPT